MINTELSNNLKFRFFFINNEVFTYIKYCDFDTSFLPKIKKRIYKGKYNRRKYVHIGCGFDIETTKIPGTDYTTMFVWQFAIGDLTIIGRTWDELRSLLKDLSDFYELDEKYRLLVFIHNEKYEWSFIKNQLKWYERVWFDKETGETKSKLDVFALDYRTIIKATTNNFIEFRDSYALTGMGLAKLAENYKLGIKKLVGDFDYSKPRHSGTKLTDLELAYCINDVQILSKFYHKYIYPTFIKKGHNIPLTSTGIVRDELKRTFKSIEEKDRNKLKRKLHKCFPNEENYETLMNYVYRGGFVHANINRANAKFEAEIMGSYDFKSSYPAVMLHEKYPWHFRKEDPEWFYINGFNKKVLKNIAYYGEFKIRDITRKTSHSIESENKIVDYSEDAVFDNGRLMSASWIVVWLTEQDVLNYLDMYNVEHPGQWSCYEIHISEKEELPHYLIDLVLKYFYLKETLEKDSLEYNLAKAKLNSFYGMCCTAILFEDLAYNEKTGLMELTGNNQSYSKAIEKLILLPQWGIWISAYARRNLIKTFAKLKNDAIYGDTDSAKCLNILANKYIFDDYNNVMSRMNKNMYIGNYDRDIFKNIGKFDFEGKILSFKTLGCKRYIYTDIHKNKETQKYELNTTVKAAGIVKGTFQKYCKENNLDMYEEFTDGLKLDENYSDKLTSIYIDEPFEYELTDYLGETKIVSENSCVTLKETTVAINMSQTYILLLAEAVKRYQRTGLVNTVWR